MNIYIFVEQYPNPYKPYFDSQFVALIKMGVKIKIFASGKYDDTINKEIYQYGLHKNIDYYPTTLKNIFKFLPKIFIKICLNPIRKVHNAFRIYNKNENIKENFMMIMRMLLLPKKEPDICLIHNVSTGKSFQFLSRFYNKAKVAMYYHGGEIGNVPVTPGKKQIFDEMNIIFTNTNYSCKHAVKSGCKKNKIKIVPVGFKIEDYPYLKNKEFMKNGILRLISVGRLSEEKGLIYAIKAIEQLVDDGIKNIFYTIVGDGYLYNELNNYINKNDLKKHVKFTGELTKAGVIDVLKEADVLILPSIRTDKWEETQACVVQEAMLMQCLAITTNTGGVPESISDDMKIYTVKDKNAKEIKEKIVMIMNISTDKIIDIRKNSRKFVIKKYDNQSIVKKMIDSI